MNRLQYFRSFLIQHRIWIVCGIAIVILILWPFSQTVKAETRHISIDATQFEFAPGRVEVNYGNHVVITLTSSDVVHGFYLDGYGIEQRVVPGVSQRIEFTANQAGKFRFRCSVSCGSIHPFMIGELVVSPNWPMLQAIGIMGIALVGTFVHLWHDKGVHDVQTGQAA